MVSQLGFRYLQLYHDDGDIMPALSVTMLFPGLVGLKDGIFVAG